MKVGVFGEIVFQVNEKMFLTINSLKRSNKGRYSEHNIIGKKPVVEFLGPGLSNITLDIHLIASMGIDPREYILKMWKMVQEGKPHTLMIGKKHRFGKFFLESVQEDWKKLNHEKDLIEVKCSLNLKEFDGNGN